MKLTDKHVSEESLNKLIAFYGSQDLHNDLVKLLLELKQRRAEDRYREHKHGASNNA